MARSQILRGTSGGLAEGSGAGTLTQHVLDEEVTEFLGRAKLARGSGSGSDSDYRNGYATSRKMALSSETIHVRRPRVREQIASSVREEARGGDRDVSSWPVGV